MSEYKNYGQSGIGPNVEIGKKGPRIKRSGDVIEHRNPADTGYTRTKGADPIDAQDYVTKKFLETNANVSVTAQIDGNSPGSGTFVGQVAVVTTAGGTYGLNELYRWDGSTWEQITVPEGLTVSVTDALTGGTVTFLADHRYLWDEDGSQWVDIGPSQGLSNVQRVQRKTIVFGDSDGAINIGDLIPSNSIVKKVTASVTQAFNGTSPTLKVGDAGDDDRFATVDEICLDAVGIYVAETYHLYGVDTQVIATLAKGASTAGQVSLIVDYVIQ